jgi:hypothetical protein
VLEVEKGQKGTIHHRPGHKGPEGEKRYSYTLSLTSAQDGVGGQRHAPAASPPGKRAGTHCIGGRVAPRPRLDRCRKSPPPPSRFHQARSEWLNRLSYPGPI